MFTIMKTHMTTRVASRIAFAAMMLHFCFFSMTLTAQTTKTIGPGGNYATVKAAFDAINSGAVTGSITLQITGSITETATAVLNASGTGSANYSGVSLYPTGSGYTISGNLAAPLLNLNGSHNVVIDGRVNATGNTRDLAIINSSTSGTSNTSTITLNNSAQGNTIKFAIIKGGATGIYSGVILFNQSSSGTGNSSNLVDNCNLTGLGVAGRPYYVIYSYGSSGHENRNNTLSNNNIFDFLSPTLSSSYGININVNSTDWTITGNSLYETTTFIPAGNYSFFGIKIANTSGNNFIITNNYIGGIAPLCGGTPWTVNANVAYRFYCIHIDAGTTTPTSIQNNIIRNFSCLGGSDIPWMGIDLNSGSVNVGTATGNTIGDPNSTGSITLSAPVASASASVSLGEVLNTIVINNGGSGYTSAPTVTLSGNGSGATAVATISGGSVNSVTVNDEGSGYTYPPTVSFNSSSSASTSYGIYAISSGAVNISNNKVGSVTTTGTTSYSHGFFAISRQSAAGATTISNNLIGSNTTAGSIQASSASTSSTAQNVYGIFSLGTGAVAITGNVISNMFNAYAYQYSTNGQIGGINVNAGVNTIQNNTVTALSSASPSNDPNGNAAVVGIAQKSTAAGQVVSGNTISNLACTYTGTRPSSVIGIYYAGGTTTPNLVSGNFIYGFSVLSTAPSTTPAILCGIKLSSGSTTAANNIISLGTGITTGCNISGIYENGVAGNNNNLWFNTVFVGGTVSSGAGASTYALFNNANTNTRDFRNNILDNVRAGGGSSAFHYAAALAGTANLTIDFNEYNVPVSGTLGKVGLVNKSNLAAWKLATGQDASSVSADPAFAVAGGTVANNYFPATFLPGVSGTGITTDYNAVARGATPAMGALENNSYTWQGNTSSDFGTPSNWTNGVVPLSGSDIYFNSTPANNCILDQNRIVGNVTNASTKQLITGGKQLTVNGSLTFSGGAQVDATAAGSVVEFGGTTMQSIPPGCFLDNTVDALTLNNVNGLTLNGDLTINQALTLSNGSLTVGAHSITLNGAINSASGTLNGGSSTNVTFGGSGPATTLPAITLNNLTLNRAGGISLGGNVTVSGILTLSAGSLVTGANTLTLSGSAPVRSAGSIDAGNAGATLVFANPGAVTIPASLFSTMVNNLTLAGAGGITSDGDFSVNGLLSLQAANPSSTKGILDMWDGAVMRTLSMGATASTAGTGDVTGIVARSSIAANTPYSFGNPFTTITMSAGTTLPSSMSCKIMLTSSDLPWKPNAIHRYYDFIQSGGSASTVVTINLHYLNSELNGTTAGSLDLFDYHLTSIPTHVDDHGHSNANATDNWVGLANMSLTYVAKTAFDSKYWTIGNATATSFTWIGASNDWTSTANWTGGIVPGPGNHAVIPDAATTANSPTLPASTTIGSILIQAGGIVNGGTGTVLTLDGAAGAWENLGTFNPGTSTVVFTNALATMADPTNFYNVTISNGASLTLGTNNVMRIGGTLSLSATGVLMASGNNNTVEYNGAGQSIISPNGSTPGYYNLAISGTGAKTMPATDLAIAGNFSTAGSSVTTAGAAMTIGGSMNIGTGSVFNAGGFNHTIGGNFDNDGTFNASAGNAMVMNGSVAQSITGDSPTHFQNLTINNIQGISQITNAFIDNTLFLTNGNVIVGPDTLGINGTISKTGGHIQVSPLSSISFGGSSAILLPDNLFAATPSILNLILNRNGGVTLGNQNLTINGTMNLIAGTLHAGANTLTLAGIAPTVTGGNLDAGNSGSTLVLSNAGAMVLPATLFSGAVNNLNIQGTGGVTASGDFTLLGVLNLQGTNPSATKGMLDLWDGSNSKTLYMGPAATTTGTGDVTGVVNRSSFVVNTPYSFGNPYTTINIMPGGVLPSSVSVKISLTATDNAWKPNSIHRFYDIVQTGGTENTRVILDLHYLDSELNGSTEGNMDLFDYHISGSHAVDDHGHSNDNSINNWVGMANLSITYIAPQTGFPSKYWTLGNTNTPSYTWLGAQDSDWGDAANWTGGVPGPGNHAVIPDAGLTDYDPLLPASTTIGSLTIQGGGILNSGDGSVLTLDGGADAWDNMGTFNAGNSTVVFTNPAATISDPTNFYNVTIADGAKLTLGTDNIMRIAGTLSLSSTGALNAATNHNTVEYNGLTQTVVLSNGAVSGYHNLVLSGSGNKTLPASALALQENLTLAGTVTATCMAPVTIGGDLTIGPGTSFTTGAFNHSIAGNFNCNGTFTASPGSTITFNGSSIQSVGGGCNANFFRPGT